MINNRSPVKSPGKQENSRMEAPLYKNGKRPSALLYVIIVAITLAAIAVTIFLGKKNYREALRLATEQFNQQQLILARSAARGIGTFIADVDDDLLALSIFPVVQRMEPGILERMEVLYQGVPPKTSSRRLDKNGILRFIYPNEGWRKDLIGREYSQETWFQKAKKTGEVVISGLIINEAGERRIRVVRPVYVEDEKGTREFNGIIICSINPETMANLYVSPIVSGDTGYAWLLNEQGIFLAHHEEAFVGRDAFSVRKEREPKLSYDAINQIQRQMMAGKEGVGRYVSGWHRGEKGEIEKLITYTPIHVLGKVWGIAVCAPVFEVERITRDMYRNELYTFGFIIFILSAAGAFLYIALYRWGSSLGQEIEVRKQAEGALRETKDYLENLISYANAPIIVWAPDFRITRFNRAFEHLTGYTADDVIGEGLHMLFPEVSQKESMSSIESTLAGKYWESVEIQILRKDGDIRLTLWNSANIYAEDGKTLLATIAQGQDITERMRAEESLRESEEKYRTLVETMTDIVFTLDTDGRFTFLNLEFEKTTGRPFYDLIGHPFTEILSPKYIESTIDRFRRGLSGETIPIYEVELLHKDGSKIPVELKVTSMQDSDGKTIGRIGVARNITERKQTEEALRKSEEHYHSIFEDSRDAVYITTRDGKFIDANQSALDLFGYSREEMASVNALQLYVHPSDAGKFEKEIGEKGFLRDYEVTFRKKDGTEMDCLLNTTLRQANDGSILAYQGIIRDMTEHKKLEAQLRQAQKMEAIGTLAGGIAHDFNNILGAIIGYTEIADLQVAEDNKAKESLKEVLTAGRRARDLVRQILAFSRKGEQERIPVQISLIVKEALKLLRSSLPTTIEIRQNIESDTDIVEADPTQIHQILMNLCTNAGHAMREEGGILEVGIRDVEVGSWDSELGYLDMAPGPYLLLTVSDTGEGMTPEVLGRIFDPYFTTKEKGVGTGLGLAVVHGIVKSHGGTIRAYSEPGKGTTFNVYLPRIKEEKEMAEVESRPGVIPTGHERVLFIDDEPVLVEIGKQMLERLGYEVTTRTSSIEALELFRAKPDQFDLVITDMTMPNMTGDKLAQEIMKVRSDIPIIICTGYSERITEDKAKGMGIKAFVMKPIVIRDLANTVREVLEGGKEKPAEGLILVIDDDDQFRGMLREMLERAGYEVADAPNGKEGIRLYRENPADLVITDIIMPEKEGIETIMDLRREFPEVKIIAMSGGGRIDPEEYLHMAKRLGADRTFAKPVEREEFLKAVGELLK